MSYQLYISHISVTARLNSLKNQTSKSEFEINNGSKLFNQQLLRLSMKLEPLREGAEAGSEREAATGQTIRNTSIRKTTG